LRPEGFVTAGGEAFYYGPAGFFRPGLFFARDITG
jgi:hypothetical protein